MGVNADEMMKAFCKPKIKVGTEWVTKGQTCEQVIFYYKIIFVPIYLSVVGIISL
jgi:myosin heavy subunit